MACNTAISFFLISLLLFASTNPLALGQNRLNGLTVSGRLCCTFTGNCPGQPLVGANVNLRCFTGLGVSTTLGQNTTNVNGNFNITVARVPGLILGLPVVPCLAIVQLPLNSTVCAALSTARGSLVSAIGGVGTVVVSTLGTVQNAITIGLFLRV
ncbi:hypothetical protein Pfo_003258 [Paulownia fortunei]|nr:hypothetical protein Pfo_003258 [Paulownia fortunei]